MMCSFLDLACYIVILQGSSLVVSQGIHIPMVYDALLDKCVKARNFHILLFNDFLSLFFFSYLKSLSLDYALFHVLYHVLVEVTLDRLLGCLFKFGVVQLDA